MKLVLAWILLHICIAEEHGQDCDVQACDATSLIQTRVGVTGGKNRTEDTIGSLVLSRSIASEDHCDIQGHFKDQSGNAAFRIQDSLLELSIEGLPTMTHHFENGKLDHVDVGGATSRWDSADSAEYKKRAKALARSAFAAKGARRLSRALHLQGLNGASAPCTFPLHMIMVSLTSFSQKSATDEDDEQESTEEKSITTKRGKWLPYGFDAECPAKGERTWHCKEQGQTTWVDDQKYFDMRSDRRRESKKLDPEDPLGPPEFFGSDVQCEQDKETPDYVKNWLQQVNKVDEKDCAGLCGATCDCWESICGDQYRCNYNPYCCAHDLACVRDGYLSVKCAWNWKDVRAACQNDQWEKDGR